MTQNKEDVDFEELETRSQVSNSSQTSKRSAATSLALKAQANAGATRSELVFAKKQQDMILANLYDLRMEAEVVEAVAEQYEQMSPSQQRKHAVLPQYHIEMQQCNACSTIRSQVTSECNSRHTQLIHCHLVMQRHP